MVTAMIVRLTPLNKFSPLRSSPRLVRQGYRACAPSGIHRRTSRDDWKRRSGRSGRRQRRSPRERLQKAVSPDEQIEVLVTQRESQLITEAFAGPIARWGASGRKVTP